MGNKLFGVDIAGIVAKEIAPGLLDATITTYTLGARTSPTSGRAKVPSTSTAKGFWEDFAPSQIDGDRIHLTDRKAVIIGDTIKAGVVIKQGSDIEIEGQTLTVVRLHKRDPAAATFIYHCRDYTGVDGK